MADRKYYIVEYQNKVRDIATAPDNCYLTEGDRVIVEEKKGFGGFMLATVLKKLYKSYVDNLSLLFNTAELRRIIGERFKEDVEDETVESE